MVYSLCKQEVNISMFTKQMAEEARGNMRKFVFIGAGSLDFTRDLVRDLMTFPAFDTCELMLMDIDEKRLAYAKQGVERIVQAGGHHAVVRATTDRREALKDADGVLITILQGGVEVWRHDIEIPKKYGVQCTLRRQ